MLGRIGDILDHISPLLRWWWAPVILGLTAALWVRGQQLDAARKSVKLAEYNLATNTLRVKAMADRALALAVQLAATAEATNRRINDETDHKARAAAIVYRDRVLRIPAAAYPGGACKAGVPEAQPAGGADRASGDAILLSRADALISAAHPMPRGATTKAKQAGNDRAIRKARAFIVSIRNKLIFVAIRSNNFCRATATQAGRAKGRKRRILTDHQGQSGLPVVHIVDMRNRAGTAIVLSGVIKRFSSPVESPDDSENAVKQQA